MAARPPPARTRTVMARGLALAWEPAGAARAMNTSASARPGALTGKLCSTAARTSGAKAFALSTCR